MKTVFTLLCILPLLLIACKKETAKPVSDTIRNVWKAQSVKEGSTTVYTRGAAGNAVPGYDNFRIDLKDAKEATLTEVTNDFFRGQWRMNGTAELVLSNLTPQPTNTNGTITYTIVSSKEKELKLIRTTASTKTGGSINEYLLIAE